MHINKTKIVGVVVIVLLFVNANVYSQQIQNYSYDGNGNLSSDANKKISSLHYNHLNLVDTITYADGRKIIYIYNANGQKLAERTILANGSQSKKRDYL